MAPGSAEMHTGVELQGLMVVDLALELHRRAKVFALAGDSKRAATLWESSLEQLDTASCQLPAGRLQELAEEILASWRSSAVDAEVAAEGKQQAQVLEMQGAVTEALDRWASRAGVVAAAAAKLTLGGGSSRAVDGGPSATTTPGTGGGSSGSDHRPSPSKQASPGDLLYVAAAAAAEARAARAAERRDDESGVDWDGDSHISSHQPTPLPSPPPELEVPLEPNHPDLPSSEYMSQDTPRCISLDGEEVNIPQSPLRAAASVAPLTPISEAPRGSASCKRISVDDEEVSWPAQTATSNRNQSTMRPMSTIKSTDSGAQMIEVVSGVAARISAAPRQVGGLFGCCTPSIRRPKEVAKNHRCGALQQRGQLRLAQDFQRGDMLGAGSFGVVFAARHVATGEIVAVKEMFLDRVARSGEQPGDRLVRLTRELRLCEQLEHPHIVKSLGHEFVIGSRDGPERVHLFLEYCSGGSLAAQLRTYGALGMPLLRKYTLQLVEGLRYLHSRTPPVVHRDLKCANVLLTHNGDVKITDFGCSKWLQTGEAFLENSVAGSIFWMAPELLRGRGRLTTSADVWSLGCCVVEMATGSAPWAERRFDNILQACHVIAESEELPPFPEDLSEKVAGFVVACLRRNPQDRPSASDLRSLPLLKHK